MDFTKTISFHKTALSPWHFLPQPSNIFPQWHFATLRNRDQNLQILQLAPLPHPVSLTNLPNQTCAPFWNHSFGFLVSVFSHLCKFRWTLVHSVLWEKFLQCFMFQDLYRLYNECYIHSKHICCLTFFLVLFLFYKVLSQDMESWMTWFLSAVWGLLTAIFVCVFNHFKKQIFFLFSSHKIWTLDRVSISSKGLFTAIFACFFY